MPWPNSKPKEIGDAIKFGLQFLKTKKIAESRLNAETLLAYVIRKERFSLYLDENERLNLWQWKLYKCLLKRRGKFIPLQYLLGSVNFFGLDFLVKREVLIPRPETEILVEVALTKLKKFKRRVKILDLGTGSGNIALTIAKLTGAEIYATDISKSALAIAKENSQRLGIIEKRIHFLQGDCFEPLKNRNLSFKLICSSPPYIPTKQLSVLPMEVGFEPRIALDGGEDGLDFFRKIIKRGSHFLTPGGYLILEIGANQSKAIKDLVKKNKSLSLESIVPDYQGIERIVIIKKSSPQRHKVSKNTK